MHWHARRAVLRCDKATYVDVPFISCNEEGIPAHHITAIFRVNMSLADDPHATHSLDHVACTRPYDTLHFLASFEHWLKENLFEQRIRVQIGPKSLVNWHCVYIFLIQTRHRKALFVQVPSW